MGTAQLDKDMSIKDLEDMLTYVSFLAGWEFRRISVPMKMKFDLYSDVYYDRFAMVGEGIYAKARIDVIEQEDDRVSSIAIATYYNDEKGERYLELAKELIMLSDE